MCVRMLACACLPGSLRNGMLACVQHPQEESRRLQAQNHAILSHDGGSGELLRDADASQAALQLLGRSGGGLMGSGRGSGSGAVLAVEEGSEQEVDALGNPLGLAPPRHPPGDSTPGELRGGATVLALQHAGL